MARVKIAQQENTPKWYPNHKKELYLAMVSGIKSFYSQVGKPLSFYTANKPRMARILRSEPKKVKRSNYMSDREESENEEPIPNKVPSRRIKIAI